MASILVPTDFSDLSLNAYEYAIQLANNSDKSIDILHVFHRPDISAIQLPPSLQKVYDGIDLEELGNFKKLSPKLYEITERYQMSHLDINHIMMEGEVVPTIHATAEKEETELIVMGTKGASGLTEKLFGSITRRVIEEGSVDILSVPEDARFDGQLNNVVFLTNYYDTERQALNKLIKFILPFKANINCVHFDIDEKSSEPFMEEWKKGVPHYEGGMSYEIIETDNIEEGLTDYCDQSQVDLVVMPSATCSFFERWFGHCLDRQLTFHLKTPLMHIRT